LAVRVPGPTLRGRDGAGRGDGAAAAAVPLLPLLLWLLPLSVLLPTSSFRRDEGGAAPARPRSKTALGDSARRPAAPDAEWLRAALPEESRTIERAIRCRPRSAAGDAKLSLLVLWLPAAAGPPGGGCSGGGGGGDMPGDALGGRMLPRKRDVRSTDLARRFSALDDRFAADDAGMGRSSPLDSFISV
jgi:hypothetical protein